jgi:hypothetical protein
MSASFLSDALWCARQGWAVLPLHSPLADGCSCRRPDCTAIGKHPRTRNGLSDATTDEQQIRAWWAKWPDANVGILTGSASGLVVIDIDNRGDVCGGVNLAELVANFGGLPDTLTAITGTGKHLYFSHPGGTVKNSTGELTFGVDVKADGGYVVAPPSRHANGNKYKWEDASKPVAELPEGLLTLMTTKKQERITKSGKERNPFTEAPIITEGSRNTWLYKLGCALRGQHGKSRDEIVVVLLEYNEAKCQPPLAEGEVITIADGVCEHPPEMSANKSGKRLEQCPLYWYPENTRELFADQDVMLMKDHQLGWHFLLMALAWDGGGFLTADRERLWRLARARSRKIFERDCELVLAAYEEVVVDGEPRLRHRKLADRYVKTVELWLKKKEAGEASRASRLARDEPPVT